MHALNLVHLLKLLYLVVKPTFPIAFLQNKIGTTSAEDLSIWEDLETAFLPSHHQISYLSN